MANNRMWKDFEPGLAVVPVAGLSDTTLSAVTRLVYVALCSQIDAHGCSRAGVMWLANLVGVTDRAVRTSLKELASRGHITRRYENATEKKGLKIEVNLPRYAGGTLGGERWNVASTGRGRNETF